MARELYICRVCQRGFDMPVEDRYFFAHAFGVAQDATPVCPHCGSADFGPAYPCGNPGCYSFRPDTDLLCPDCRRALRRRVGDFLAGLSPAELEQADGWLEGSSLAALEQSREA